MVLGEVGCQPIQNDIKQKCLSFWGRLINGKDSKYSKVLYDILLYFSHTNTLQSSWINYVESSLNHLGFGEYWIYQTISVSHNIFKNQIKRKIQDQFLQSWQEDINNSGKGLFYKTIKNKFYFEPYLDFLPFKNRIALCKFENIEPQTSNRNW